MSDPRYDRDPYRQMYSINLSDLTWSINDYHYKRTRSTEPFANEPPMIIMDVTETHNEKAERLNGRLAMLGVIAAMGA